MIVSIIAGFLSGVAAAMGLGGGFVLLIYLTVIANLNQLRAQGVNLIFFIPIAILSVIIHRKNGLIEKEPLMPAIVFGIVGVFAGTFLAFYFPVDLISKMFAVLIFAVGAKELFHKKKH